MDSKNTTKREIEINLKDTFQYILSKAWIVALATLLAIVVSFLYTFLFVEERYTSEARVFIYNSSDVGVTDKNSDIDWTLSRQYAVSSPEFVTEDFCQVVINKLLGNNLEEGQTKYDCSKYLGKTSFKEFYTSVTGKDTITALQMLKYLTVESNGNTCVMMVTADTEDAKLSAIIANAVADSFEDYLADVLETDEVKAKVTSSGKVPLKASNEQLTKNIALGAVLGLLISCGVLFLVFILNDKIRTPEDIEKFLGISVLGSIPELEKDI